MSLINTISTECTPEQNYNFDEIFQVPQKETSDFNFLEVKPKQNFINICKKQLKLKKYENNLIIDH